MGPKVHGSVYTDDVNVAGVKAKHVAIGSSKSNFLGANEDQDLLGWFGFSYPNIGSYDVPVENTYDVASKDKKNFFYDDIFQFYIRRSGDSYMDGINSWIYGMNFSQAFTVILDFGKERMGLGKQKKRRSRW